MKPFIISLLLISTIASSSRGMAQGTVAFNNSSTTLVQQWADATGSTLMAVPKGAGYVQLVYAPSGTPLTPLYGGQTASAWISANPGWTLGPVTPISPVAGRFNGGIVALNGVAAGANADYIVLGWTGAQTSYDAALADPLSFVGTVGGYPYRTATGGVDPLIPPPSIASTFTGGLIAIIPEPSSLSLGVLGLCVWVLRKRR